MEEEHEEEEVGTTFPFRSSDLPPLPEAYSSWSEKEQQLVSKHRATALQIARS